MGLIYDNFRIGLNEGWSEKGQKIGLINGLLHLLKELKSKQEGSNFLALTKVEILSLNFNRNSNKQS